jgi:Domain of unknown function (DUF1844)
MSDAAASTFGGADQMGREEMFSGLFAQLVIQQSNMAMMLLGKMPHPETGKTIKDTEAARLFIDQLEMLEAKTKGNLSREESALLKQSLMSLRLAFVDAVDSLGEPGGQKPPEEPQKMEPSAPSTAASTPKAESSAATEEEHRKKFSKKY